MDIVQIQALIAKGKVVSITDIDPTQSFVQIGVYQPDNRKIGSANNTYPSFVIPLSELGGGGASTLQQVTDLGNTTTNDIQLINDAEVIFGAGGGVLLDNGSRLREGTIDAGLGGSKGIAQICAVGYELKWEAGRLYVMDGNGNGIRLSLYNFNITPTATDDDTKGYGIGSLWVLDDNTTYICSDATTGAAVWTLPSTNSIKGNTLNATIDLNTTADQIITLPATGNYIIDKVYVHSATINLYSDPSSNLQVIDGVDVILQSKEDVPGGYEQLNSLLAPANYMYLQYTPVPPCWPPPCNINRIIAGGSTLTVKMQVASAVPATVKISIVLYNID